MKINPVALMNLGLSSLGILYAINKKPPEWLILGSFAVSIITATKSAHALIEPENAVEVAEVETPEQFIGLSGVSGCGCKRGSLL